MAEHLDHLHYLNDILIINCEFLNDVLTDHLLNRLFLPLYVYSLENPDKVSLQLDHCLLSVSSEGQCCLWLEQPLGVRVEVANPHTLGKGLSKPTGLLFLMRE